MATKQREESSKDIRDTLIKLGSIKFHGEYSKTLKMLEEGGSANEELTKVVNRLALQYIVDMQESSIEKASSIDKGRLVKTRLCYHYMSYGCLRGSRCKFAHGITDLRVRQPLMSELLFNEKNDNDKTANGPFAPGDMNLRTCDQNGVYQDKSVKRALQRKRTISDSGPGVFHILFPSELTGTLRTTFKEGETKKYDKRTLLIFQHMYVNPPPGLDVNWLASCMKDITFQWAKSKRITKRRVSDAGLTGWRLHDESRAASNIADLTAGDTPELGLPSENQVKRERRNSFPDAQVLTEVAQDWQDAVESASKLPSTPGPGIKKSHNPFSFSNQEKMSHLKKALLTNAKNESQAGDTPILTFAQRLRAMT